MIENNMYYGAGYGSGLAFFLGAGYRDYFSSLPEEVQEESNLHEDRIHSEEDLREYAEHLMQTS